MKRDRKPLPEDEPQDGAPEWMTTYSDLVTLLLTFFILLFSMASVDKQKFEQVAFSLRSAFMNISSGEVMQYNNGEDYISITDDNVEPHDEADQNNESKSGKGTGKDGMKGEKDIEQFKDEIEILISGMDLGEYVRVIEEKTFITLRIDSLILFDLGKADIKPSGKEPLKKIGNLLDDIDNMMSVQGHTDNLPINTLLFPTNWELSTKRATNVVIFLIKESNLDPTRLTATGNGEFRPIAPNDTEENRQKNRRIDIVIEK
jgi:chemotaxis protein MotB